MEVHGVRAHSFRNRQLTVVPGNILNIYLYFLQFLDPEMSYVFQSFFTVEKKPFIPGPLLRTRINFNSNMDK